MQLLGIPANIAAKTRHWKDSPGKVDKRSLTERDICTKFILPAVTSAGWDAMQQVREEVYFASPGVVKQALGAIGGYPISRLPELLDGRLGGIDGRG